MRDEADLRAALRTLERHAPDPDAVLLAVRSSADSRPGRRDGRVRRAIRARRRWTAWFAPLAAAAAVVVVITGLTLVTGAVGPPGQRPPGGTAHGFTPVAPFPRTAAGIPAYYLVTPNPPANAPGGWTLASTVPPALRSGETLPIIATATGQVAATVRLPGYVTGIAASSGAFFAAVITGNRAWFYEIALTGHGTGARATRLPIAPDSAAFGYLAVSPNGSRLAYSTMVRHGNMGDIQNLVVASTSRGAQRRWTTPARDSRGSMGPMQWLADGKTLAFNWTGAAQVSPSTTLRLLDTTAPGHDLMSSTAVLRLVNRAGSFDDYTISPDGRTLIGIVACLPGCAPGSPGTINGRRVTLGSVVRFSAASRAPTVAYTEPPLPGAPTPSTTCNDPWWISYSGRRMLLECFQHRPARPGRKALTVTHVLLLDHGKATELPWHIVPSQWLAFPGITGWDGIPALPPPP